MAKEKNPKRLVDVFSATTKGFGADILPAGFGYNKKYRYKVNLHQYGVGYDIITWCLKNCKSKWGWYFGGKLYNQWFQSSCISKFRFILKWYFVFGNKQHAKGIL